MPFLAVFKMFFLCRIKWFMLTIHLVAGCHGYRLKTLYISYFRMGGKTLPEAEPFKKWVVNVEL